MSHELTQHADGRVEFAYRADHGEPWHGLGTAVPNDQSRDIGAWRDAAHFNWKVARSRVRYGDGPNQRIFDDAHVLFRSDNKAPLGIVSPTYKIVQPQEVLGFFRDVVAAQGFELSAVGSIFGGKRFWATAKIGETAPASLRDKVDGFLLLSTSADGSLATEARLTSTRVVCRNTLGVALGEKAAVRITHRSVFDPEAIKRELGITDDAWASFRRNLVRLANTPIRDDEAEHVVASVLAGLAASAATPAAEAARDKVRDSSRGYRKVLDLFNGQAIGSDLPDVRGTAWGLLNAFTEYTDHWAPAQSEENRLVSAQWGRNAALKDRALQTLLATS